MIFREYLEFCAFVAILVIGLAYASRIILRELGLTLPSFWSLPVATPPVMIPQPTRRTQPRTPRNRR